MSIKAIVDDKSFKKVEDWLKGLSEYSEEELFNLLFSLAARLEALVHGKNIDGTLKEKEENPKEKIQTFLAVPKCFQESELRIFDYWIEIIEMKTKNSQKPIYGVAIFKEKYDEYKSDDSKEKAFKLSRENYQILKQLNDQKFSIYESSNLLRAAFNTGYSPRISIPRGKIPQIFVNLLRQINSVFYLNWKSDEYWDKNYTCAYAIFFQNISENLMKMISDKTIDPELHLDSQDKEIREKVQKDVQEKCKKFDNKEAKIIFLNNVHYELAINFEFNQWKEVHDKADNLLSDWVGDYWTMYGLGLLQLSEELYLKENALQMLRKIEHFTSEKTNRKAISIIEALIGKEFNLGSLFEQIKTLVEVAIPEEQDKFWKAKKEINTEQLEKDFKFLKNNPKSIAEEKYQKVVAIICTIKQHGKTVKMLKSKITSSKIQEQLKELSSNVQQYRTDLRPKLWKQTEEFCNQLKHTQINLEEIASGKILLSDLQFEIDEIWWSFKGGLKGIEAYYLSIPLMQLTEEARNLAKTFGKMLENVKEHYTKSIE